MAVFKCKMCGGALEVIDGSSTAECEYCGSKQTLPRLNDERVLNLYERASHFRRMNEFDKATALYEQILNENPQDAESYWSLVLCRYGIEYVEDPMTKKRIPTVNRAQYTSIYDDDNYLSAIRYAEAERKVLYEEEAEKINEIQKGILEISQKEENFDVFICYKETDECGQRTRDSVYATDLYHELTKEGFKVFFARITLEDKLGTAYEPYIFAALNSAKVMVVVGTKPEYFNAVWVRNEWSRFLSLIKGGAKKVLIPAYSGMDPYDLPIEFSHLQALDMTKLGFMSDLVRGIKKLTGKDDALKSISTGTYQKSSAPSGNVGTLLQRVSIFLENQDWSSADSYCEKVLDIDPVNGQAYTYKLFAQMRVTQESELIDCNTPLENQRAYKNAVRYADEETSSRLIECNRKIKERLAEEEAQRREQERIRREQEQIRRERAEQEAQRKKQEAALCRARDNVAERIQSQIHKKEALELELAELQNRSNNTKKYKRSIRVPALIIIVLTIFHIIVLEDNTNGGLMLLFWLGLIITDMVLAHARGKSKIAAMILQIVTCGFFGIFSALKALKQSSESATIKNINAAKEALRPQMEQVVAELSQSRESLNELNGKLEEFYQQNGGPNG